MAPKKGSKQKTPLKSEQVTVPLIDTLKNDYFGRIEIHILNLESKVETGTFTLIIVYGNNFIGKVSKINIPDGGGDVDINRKFFLFIKAVDNYVMDALLSTPFFFSLIEGENKLDPKLFATLGVGAAIQSNVVGQGNLGIMPLLTGQHQIQSNVVLEPPGVQDTVFFRRTYSEHPRISVKLVDSRKNLSAKEMNNIMWLSVESVYNLDKSHFLEDAEHTLVFPMPSMSIDEEHAMLEEMFAVGEEPHEEVKPESKKTASKKSKPKTKSQKQQSARTSIDTPPPQKVEIKKPPDLDLIQFDRGIYKWEQTVDIRKKWASLASINGAPAMTDQRIRTDGGDLLSTVAIDIRKKFRSKSEPRIEWNMVRPIWLHRDLESLVKERIMQYGVWPFELLMLGKLFVERDQLPGSLKEKLADDNDMMEDLKTEIDSIFSEFKEVLDIMKATGNEKSDNKAEMAKKVAGLESRVMQLLSAYEPKKKKKFLAHMPFIERIRESKKLAREEGSTSIGDSTSESTEGPKEFLNQDDIVLLERKAYVAWVDLSPLLVPGCTHLRTAGVLQYFNREEAVAKWGLTTTFSGDPEEMISRDKDLSRMLRKDPADINKIYMDLKKSDLVKGSTNLLLLLGHLLELAYNLKESELAQPVEHVTEPVLRSASEIDEKKRTKTLKFHDGAKKKIKSGKRSKLDATESLTKARDFGNVSPKAGRLKTDSTGIRGFTCNDSDSKKIDWLEMKAFDVKEMRKPSSVKSKDTTPKTPKSMFSTVNDEQLLSEDENILKTKAMQYYLNKTPSHSQNVFAIYETEGIHEGKTIKSSKKYPQVAEENFATESMETLPTELPTNSIESSPKGFPSDQKKILHQRDSKLKTKYKPDKKSITKQSFNEQEEPKKLETSDASLLTNTSDHQSSIQTTSLEMSQLDEDEPVFELFKTLLINIINKYQTLKNKYQALKKIKAKEGVPLLNTSDQDTISFSSEGEYDGEYTDEYLSSNDETNLTKVEPRHKMWHIGQNLSDDLMDNQIQYTNDVRKMAVLEREFLLLKRLRLAQLKFEWEEKLKDIMPEYLENSKGQKVVVIIEIKLLKPLIPKPTLTEINMDIQELVKNRCEKKKPLYYVNDTVDDFHNCIVTLTDLITTEYQDFKKSYSILMDPLSGDDGNDFYAYLEKSRAHQIITESLSEGMKGYLSTALRDPIPTADKNDQKKLRYYVGWLYARIVDEMQSVVNKTIIDGDHSLPETNVGDLPNISSYDLFLFAVEAIEEMDYDRAKYYLSKRLDGDKKSDPMLWIEYAVIALRIGDFQQAMECVKEALLLNSRCKEGLLFYAVMLMTEGKFEDAQVFFNALINFYPMFVEGWMAFHMFYLIVENKTGADITLVAGTKINYDFKISSSIKPPQLSWDNKTWIGDEPGNYISTAIYFLSFNLYEFAEVCLAQELERVGTKTLVWVYYLSVCHYIQGRYEDSAKHLSKAIAEVNDYNMDPRIWILLGHNCWMMGLKKCAVQMYLQAFTKKRTDLYEHMTYIRCGFFFLEHEQAKFAKQMFLRAVKQQGTPMGWLGLGISLFMEGKIEDAELALKEANMLDTTLATAWGYLALISLYKLKEDQFLHCFREAKRYGLNDKKLALEIESISREIVSYNKSKNFDANHSS
ncbi:unnamed protein product [Nezara viridula]|uniref:Tetratricopeptide repeat protein 18 n=2 Tax=Nezara viridula TaxID=85310 RepID=A0A9P0HUT0_NEZVI|nr:unnamed protein product [Nezara viridula]